MILNPEVVNHAHNVWLRLRRILGEMVPSTRASDRHRWAAAKKPMSGWFATFFALQVNIVACYITGCVVNTKSYNNNITSFYGSSCANNGKGALNTPKTLQY